MGQTRKRKLKEKKAPELPVLNPTAAGIDIGATEIYVAVHPECDPEPVRCFATFTGDLQRLADWLKTCGVDSVAMESTGVYWIPLFQLLEERGFEVCLVNARYYQNVPGRRTDVSDCQWLRHLHSVGLLRPSFRPADQVCALRSLVRHRESLIQAASSHVLRMQKALNQMNLQIHHVISDITGVTGLRIIQAVLDGERDPVKLAGLRDVRIKASEETIVKSLVGDYRREHLFTLRQSLAAWRNYQKLMTECDREIEEHLTGFDAKIDALANPLPAAKVRRRSLYTNEPSFDLRGHLYRIFGVDLTAIPGISVLTAHTLLAEVGPDLARFRSGAAFASWLGLCPDNDISGGKTLSVKTRPVNNRAATALRMAVNGLHKSQTWLGNFFRRMRAKLGPPKAITATAHKLARIVFQILSTRQPYDESIFAQSEQTARLRTEARLKAQAKALGFHLVPAEPTAA